MPSKFQKYVRRMNTKASDIGIPDEDLRLVINAEYDPVLGGVRKVKGYSQVGDQMTALNSNVIDTDEEWDAGTHSSTDATDDILRLQGGQITQSLYDDSHTIYGANWVAQSFVATSTRVTKINAWIDKVTGSSLPLYDALLNGSSSYSASYVDSSKWNTTGTVTAKDRSLVAWYRVGGTATNSSFTTDNKTSGDPILGFKVYSIGSLPSGGVSNGSIVELTNGTDYVRIAAIDNNGTWRVSTAGTYGTNSNLVTIKSENADIEVKPDGNDIAVIFNGVEITRLLNMAAASNSYFRIFAAASTHAGENYSGMPNNSAGIGFTSIYLYQNITALTDIDVRIESDSASAPSGSAIANGTTTIDDVLVTSDVSQLQATFSTAPTVVSGTTYWLIFKTTGGDSSNYYRVYKKNLNVYLSGICDTSTTSGATWGADPDGSTDLAFIIYQGYATSGNWISANQTLATGQTLSQLIISTQDLSTNETISRVDITNTSNAVQSSYTTPITSGTVTTLRSSDFSSGFTYTSGNTFRVKLTLTGGATSSPGIQSISLDSPETKILELSPLYQGATGTKTLMAVIAGTVKRLISGQWTNIKTNLTSGLETGSAIYRASKQTTSKTATATGGDLSTLADTADTTTGLNQFQGYMIEITGGTGIGQLRVIQSNTGTSTSTTTSTTTTTTTSTTTTTTSSSTSTT